MSANTNGARGRRASIFQKENQDIERLHRWARDLAEAQTIREKGQLPSPPVMRNRWYARRSDLQKNYYVSLLEQGYHGWFLKHQGWLGLAQYHQVLLPPEQQINFAVQQRLEHVERRLVKQMTQLDLQRCQIEQLEREINVLREAASRTSQDECLTQQEGQSSNVGLASINNLLPHSPVGTSCIPAFMPSPTTTPHPPQYIPQNSDDMSSEYMLPEYMLPESIFDPESDDVQADSPPPNL